MNCTKYPLITLLLAGLLLAPWANNYAAEKSDPPSKYLVYISLDAFNPEWYQNDEWPMPFLQEKAREGAYAKKVSPPFPSTTRPGHVTLITGLLPANHGVYNNSISYQMPEGSSLFHGVKAKGGSTAAVVWVGSHEAPVDHYVQNLKFIDFGEAETIPLGKDLISPDDEDVKGMSPKFKRYIKGTIRDAQLASMGVTYIERHKPNFLALRFNDTDKIQHYFGRDAVAVKGKVASIDMSLAEVEDAVERAGIADETVFVVSGDHGMDNIHTVYRPNVWLDEAGLGNKDGPRFEAYGGSAFLHDVNEDEAEEIKKMLRDLPDDASENFQILSRECLDELGADPRAVFALTAAEGYRFDGKWQKPAGRSTDIHGTHGGLATPETPHNYTGFVIWGAGIESSTVIDEMELIDVAPTAAELMGVNIGQTDGESYAPLLQKQ